MLEASEHVICNLCGADDYDIVYTSTLNGVHKPDLSHFRCTSSSYGVHPRIVKCKNCGLVYANPRLHSDTIHESYASVADPMYEQERAGRLITFRRNLRPLDKMVNTTSSPRRLLDVGAHIGVLVEVAREYGWDAWGVEPSHWAAERAQERGLRVLPTTLRAAQFESDFFDGVSSQLVLPFMERPMDYLQEHKRVLKKGGIFAVSGPSEGAKKDVNWMMRMWRQDLIDQGLWDKLGNDWELMERYTRENVKSNVQNWFSLEEISRILSQNLDMRIVGEIPNPMYYSMGYFVAAEKK